MAISFLQRTSGGFAASAASLQVNITASTAGSIIVVAGSFARAGTLSSIVDSAGDAVTTVIAETDEGVSFKYFCSAFLAPATGVTFAKVNFSVNPGFGDMFVWEIAGLTSPVVDKHPNTVGINTGTAVASGTTGTLSASAEAAIAYATDGGSITAGGAGWVNFTQDPTTLSGGEEQVVASNAALNGQFTGSNNQNWAALCATFMSGTATTPNGWWRDETERLLRAPVRFDTRGPAFVSTFKTAVIAGTAWHRDFPEANPRPPIRFQPPPPAFISTFKIAPISGMAWFEPPDRDRVAVKPIVIPPAWDPRVFVTAPIAWFEPPDRDRPAIKINGEAPPALSLTPATLPPPIAGMAWFEPPDRDKIATKIKIESPSATMPPVPPASVASISGMAWFEPPDRDKPAIKVSVEAPPAIALTPATLPPQISGMAWFEPRDRDKPVVKVTVESVLAWDPQVIAQQAVTAPPNGWLTTPSDQPQRRPPLDQPVIVQFTPPQSAGWPQLAQDRLWPKFRLPDIVPAWNPANPTPQEAGWWTLAQDQLLPRSRPWDIAPAFAFQATAVGISGMAWFEPPDRDRPSVRVTVEALPAISLTPATLPVGIFGMAWFEPPDRDRPVFRSTVEAPPAWEPQFIVPPTPPPQSDFTYPFIANVGTLMNR